MCLYVLVVERELNEMLACCAVPWCFYSEKMGGGVIYDLKLNS